MKNYFLIVLLSFLGICQVKGQNHDIHVYLNNGDIHSFFYERADSITLNGIEKQNVWTIDSIYCVNISEIDSICFGNRELPISFYAENFADWSDVLFCNNGMVAFHANKTESEPEKSLILIPDETYGLICSYALYDDNSNPYIVSFNDDVIYISKDDTDSPIYTVIQGDSIIYQIDSKLPDNNGSRNLVRRAWGDNNWPRRLIGIGQMITGGVEVVAGGFMVFGSVVGEAGTFGASTPISVPGLVVGSLWIKGGTGLFNSGFTTTFIPAAKSYKGLDKYSKEAIVNTAYDQGIEQALKSKKGQKFLRDCLPDNAQHYLKSVPKERNWSSWTFWAEMSLYGLDAFFGETITKTDKMKAFYDKGNVITGIVKDITPYSATVRGYVSPELTYGLNGENIDVEYGIIVKGNGANFTKKLNNEHGGLIELYLEGLSPSCEYTYFAYVWDRTDAILRYGDIKSFITPTLPVAVTGECSNITLTSSIVSCAFENVPEDGVCGIEYTWNNGSISKSLASINGSQNVSLSNLTPGTTYTYCAFVEAYGQTYYGEYNTFTTESINCFVNLSDFKVTRARYKEDGFENDGIKYDYRFDASVTATLYTEDVSYITKWGYVYEDPNGNKAEIPLSEFGTEYTDSRFAYFRNTPHSTARLYGFAYIVGCDNPIYGEVHDYPLDYYMPTATTGDYSNVTKNSATVLCTYENVPEGGVCGVEYTWDGGSHKQSASSSNGTQTITLSGLKSGTTYTYRAYIEDDGQMFYGGEKSFTTEVELPDLSGTWSCTIYKDDGSVLDTPSITLTSDGKATQKNSSFTPESEVGGWSINTSGAVGINFSWAGGSWSHPVWYGETWSGTVNSLSNPSTIEGSVYRGWAGISEHGNSYKFKMTR